MEYRDRKDAVTLLIARTIGLLVVVLIAGYAGLLLADRLGFSGVDSVGRFVVAASVLISVGWLLRQRRTLPHRGPR